MILVSFGKPVSGGGRVDVGLRIFPFPGQGRCRREGAEVVSGLGWEVRIFSEKIAIRSFGCFMKAYWQLH